jgi:hypothetical protein
MKKLIISTLVLSGVIIGEATSFTVNDTRMKRQRRVREQTEKGKCVDGCLYL